MANLSDSKLRLLLLCLFLAGCAGKAPVYDIDAPRQHLVRKGDTLYSIAFRYRLDYKSIARINGINSPYTIYIGQKLNLSGTSRVPAKDGAPPGDDAKPAVPATAGKKSWTPAPPVTWHWPLDGRTIGRFSLAAPVNKGIDIAGKWGGAVQAAADGVVVYAGGNLRGYGKLVIIKHNDTYLSAYGNNARILVKEGDAVKAGKKIATVGSNSADVALLHFEIREQGIPKNPVSYLPRR